MNLLKLFTVGDTIHGYCNGYFGRDDYDDKTCVMVTNKYAVFENEAGYATVLNANQHISPSDVAEWKKEEA